MNELLAFVSIGFVASLGVYIGSNSSLFQHVVAETRMKDIIGKNDVFDPKMDMTTEIGSMFHWFLRLAS
jgi:hypothetical protein